MSNPYASQIKSPKWLNYLEMHKNAF